MRRANGIGTYHCDVLSYHLYMIMASESAKKLHFRLKLEAGEPGSSNRSPVSIYKPSL